MAGTKLFNKVRQVTATTGTGAVTLGAASANNFLTAVEAGVADGNEVSYELEEGTDFEMGKGTIGGSGTTCTRDTVYKSKIAGTAGTSKMNLGGSATWRIVDAAEDHLPPASQAEMEAAVSVILGVTPGRQHFHPAHPKAIWRGTLGFTAVTGNVSSVDTGTDIITWSAAHGLTTGEQIYMLAGVWPTGMQGNSCYYVNALSSTTFAVYATYVDALANTNKVNLTAAGSGTRTMRRLTYTSVFNSGLPSQSPVAAVPAQTAMAFEVNLSTALSGITALKADLEINSRTVTGFAAHPLHIFTIPDITTVRLRWVQTEIIAFDPAASSLVNWGGSQSWSSQEGSGSGIGPIEFMLWGDY